MLADRISYENKIKSFFNENAFLLALFLITAMYALRFSLLANLQYAEYLFTVMRIMSYTLISIKFIIDVLNHKYSFKEFIIISILGIYLIYVSYNSRTINYLVYYIYVIVGKNVNYTKILKTTFTAIALSIMVVLILFHAGIIDEVVSIQNNGERVRHSCGFVFASYLSTYCFYATLYCIYYKNKNIKFFELIILAFISIYIFCMTNTKSAFAFSILAIITTILVKYIKFFNHYNKISKMVLYFFSTFSPISILLLSMFYDGKNTALSTINRVLSGRLSLAHIAINKYGIKAFGQFIKFNAAPLPGEVYEVVDSSYILYILILGSIFFILLIALLIYMAYLIDKKKDVYLAYIFIILIIHSMFDPQLLQMSHSAFFYVLSYKNVILNNE